MKRCLVVSSAFLFVALSVICARASLFFSLSSPPGPPTVVLSNPGSIPAGNVVVAQTNMAWAGGTGIQTRNRLADLSDWRGISQTFLWTATNKLDGIGLRMAGDQPAWSANQQYVLTVQALSGATPTATVAEIEFTMATNLVAANQWLFVDFDDVDLINGQWYGFTLCPADNGVDGIQRAYWAAADNGNYYAGRGAQWNPDVSGLPKTDDYGSAGTDFVFYLQSANAPSSWIFVGNEKEEIVDAETGRTVIYLTRGESLDTHFHYHGGSWGTINGATYLFFASSRERPAGVGPTLPGERQLMAANVETGDLYYLTSIPNPLEGRLYYHRPYQATYNDDLKTIFFWGLRRHQLYAHNCVTGVRTLLVTLPSTHDSRLLDDFVDATSVRLIYPVSDRATDLEYIEVADFDRDLNPLSRTVVRTSPVGDALNHVEIRPDDKDVFFYKHHQNVDSPSYQAILKVADLNSQGDIDHDIVVNPNETPYVDHMIWGKSGDHIYWDDNAGHLWDFSWSAQTNAIVGGASPIHNQLSSDEQLWVYDRRVLSPYFSQPFEHITLESWEGSIWIHDMATDTSEKQANIIWASPHPRHPHAIFSPDDSMISFVTGMDNENSRVAIMQVVGE